MSSSVQAGTCFPFACINRSTSRHHDRVRKADRPQLHDLFGSLFLRTPPASIQFLVVVQADLHREGAILSEIDVELTSQTVVFACFFCRGAASRSSSIFHRTRPESLRQRREKCFARRLRSELPDQAALAFATWVSIAYTTRAEHSNADLPSGAFERGQVHLEHGKPPWPESMVAVGTRISPRPPPPPAQIPACAANAPR